MIFVLQKEQAETLAQLICAGRYVLGTEEEFFDAQQEKFALSFLETLFCTENFDERYENTMRKVLPALRCFQAETDGK